MIKHDHGFPTVCVFTHTIMRLIHTIEKPFYRQIENENLHQISCQRIIQILQLDICIKKFQKKKIDIYRQQSKKEWLNFFQNLLSPFSIDSIDFSLQYNVDKIFCRNFQEH